MELLNQGLMISAIGLVAAFLAMSLFIGIIVGLKKFFPPKIKVKENLVANETTTLEQSTSENPYANDEEAIVAAIVVALLYAQTHSQGSLGADLLSGRGLWWSANQLISRQNQ